MKKFIRNIFLAVIPLVVVFIISFGMTTYKISSSNYFTVPSNIHSIIMGHSHSACAFNDSLIDGFLNLSQNTEGYPYTYFKAKKILEQNKNVKNLFIEYTNNQVSTWAINRISGIYLDNNMPRMFPVLSKRFIIKTFYKSNNPKRIINSILSTYRNNINFLYSGNNYINEYWHNHQAPSHIFNGDSTVNLLNFDNSFIDIYSIQRENIYYLFKIKELCKEYQVNLVFIRSPIPNHVKYSNESIYKHIKDTFFSNIPLLDFKDYPLNLDYFADNQHVNTRGREIISTFFNAELIQEVDGKNVYVNIVEQARTHNILYK